MRSPADDVTPAELAVLQVLWDQGEATRRTVTDALYPGGGDAHYGTVQKLLERLEAKDFVSRTREGGNLLFRAVVDREALIGRRLRDVADKLCDGSITPLLTHLVRSQGLKPKEVEELQTLLNALRRQEKPKGKGNAKERP